MQEINLEKVEKIYFIGIGGIAMSATASLALEKGFEVLGSDDGLYSPSKEVLEKNKIEVHNFYNAENIEESQADLFVISAGIPETNPEFARVIEKDLLYCSFPEFLAKLADTEIKIVVTGTHGKSTTSALVGYLLSKIDNSSFMVGGVIRDEQVNYHLGDGNYFVFEGDEYKALNSDPTPKFHYYKPDLLVLTNLEYDHPDLFGSLEELQNEYEHLIANLPEDGIVIFNVDDVELEKVVFKAGRPAFSFGRSEEANVRLIDYTVTSEGTQLEVEVKFNETAQREKYVTKLFGEINVYNAMAAITLLRALGFAPELISGFLSTFQGLKRRFEILGEKSGVVVIDDYAHHPTAVSKTIATAREAFPDKKIWTVFEPHTFSRTEQLFSDFAKCFNGSNEVLLATIYPAREKGSDFNITSEKLLEAVKENNPSARLVNGKEDALSILKAEAKPGDVVLVMAVGDFNLLGPELLENL